MVANHANREVAFNSDFKVGGGSHVNIVDYTPSWKHLSVKFTPSNMYS